MKKIIYFTLLLICNAANSQYCNYAEPVDITNTTANVDFGIVTQGNPSNVRVRLSVAPNSPQTGITINYPSNPVPASGSASAIYTMSLGTLMQNTTYNFIVEVTNPTTGAVLTFNGAGIAGERTFTTSGPPASPVITIFPTNNTSSSSTNVLFSINPRNAATTPIVRYGLSANNLNLSQVGTLVTGNTTVNRTISLSGLSSNTIYYFIIESTNTAGTTTAPATGTAQFTSGAGGPTITNNTVSGLTATGATINFDINPNGTPTFALQVRYKRPWEPNYTLLTVAGASGSTTVSKSQIITGLQPGTTYNYYIYCSNTNGNIVEFPIPVATFTTPALAPQLLYHFPFNGSMASIVNTGTLTSTISQNYVSNGIGANQALNVVVADTDAARVTAPTAALNLLPSGSAPRSVVMRLKLNQLNTFADFPFFWGLPSNSNAFTIEPNIQETAVSSWGSASNGFTNVYNFVPATNTWYTVCVTFDGTQSKLYVDNTNYASQTLTVDTRGNDFFLCRTGASNYGRGNMAFDDLKIYNYALSQAEINALSNQDFQANNLKFSLYPNPANHLVNISMETELKSVEIYTLQGQRVLTTDKNQVDVSLLASGMYLVRVEDANKGISTQKLVLE